MRLPFPRRTSVLLITLLLAGSAIAYWLDEPVRTNVRWLVSSQSYKHELMSLPPTKDPHLQHILWDQWGWVGAGSTVIYLVADPKNTLSEIVAKPGTVAGLPCKVLEARALEPGWYTVLFYTDTDWEHCD
jgi:hypothetical protein